ncbi:MAG: type II CRISPR RNA-guided endonuclease Cas9 [Bacteroidales bacterium]|nr:type II CRISPR RNA-guided endonuclease Cas9 [Bacteroidales bacterium]
MKKILGLDLGTNSIGWAVVEEEKGKEFKLVDKGVRIFQEGVKIEKGVEGSKAAERTGFRSARRIKYRRKLRKIATLSVLSEFGYCPKLTKQELESWRYEKIYPQNEEFRNWLKTDEFQEKTPYYFRNLAVTEKMDLNDTEARYSIGRAFYHMAQRRGFLSNRLDTTNESEGEVKKTIAKINEEKGDLTLGQYFYEKYISGEKIRDTYTHREDHYLEEFNRICTFQNLPIEFTEKVRNAIFYQRPLKSQKGLIGKCVFEPSKPRCSTSRIEFEEYRMLCFLNNIKVKTPEDDQLRSLNAEEREKILPLFFRKSKEHFDFEDLAKQLAPKKQYKYFRDRNILPEDWLFNYNMKTVVSGCPVTARFREFFGEDLLNYKIEYTREKDGKVSSITIHDVWHVLYTFDSDEKLAAFAKNKLLLDEEQVKVFLKIKLSKEFSSLSLKAIRKILPYLRTGLIYSHAVFLANMEEVIPREYWKEESTRRIIEDEIFTIIQTQSRHKQIVDAVNGVIKKARENLQSWSEEASQLFLDDLNKNIRAYFGEKEYDAFSEGKKNEIEQEASGLLISQMNRNMGKGEFAVAETIEERVFRFVTDHFDVKPDNVNKLYHPSAIDVYKPPVKLDDGKYYLGSPMVSSVRNPMAMRAMHQLRKVINELIKEEIVDKNTRVNIEMSRGLLNANERKGIRNWQTKRENAHQEYAKRLKEYLKGEEPTKEDILKYQLWEEQKHKCIYTGNEIAISEFIGPNPSYDIEHTIPRSQSFDNSQTNKTLADSKFNRSVKKNRIPYELDNHAEILERLEEWRTTIENLNMQIQREIRNARRAADKDSKDRAITRRHELAYERDYWQKKYSRFTMKEVPEGFKNSQINDTGIITKYARLYLKTMFDKVYTVKGSTVADFRKIWGLQEIFEKKERVNHIHHCIDAVTIACITKDNYERLAKFYHDWEEMDRLNSDKLPKVDKPWNTFAEDVKNLENEVLVSHYTPDVLPKQSKKKMRIRGKIQYNKKGEPIFQKGDTVRGSLHKETFYGAIKREGVNKKGEKEDKIRFVVRKSLSDIDDSNIKNIVDNRVREIVREGRIQEKQIRQKIEELGRKKQKAEENEEPAILAEIENLEKQIEDLYSLPNKNGEPVPIRKARVFQPTITNPLKIKKQRDVSLKNRKPYKEDYYAANDGNYLIAIYEGRDTKGKVKRDFEIINNMEAGEFFKDSVQRDLKTQDLGGIEGLINSEKTSGKLVMKHIYSIKTGCLVIFWKNSPDEIWDLSRHELTKRLYKVIKMSKDGRITFKFHQEARNDEKLKSDYENKHGVKPPKSLTNGESKFDFVTFPSKLRLTPSNFNFLLEKKDFIISPLGEILKSN